MRKPSSLVRGHGVCSNGTSGASSTTSSRRSWKTTSTGSRPATSNGRRGSAASTSATTATEGLKELVSDLSEIDARAVNTIEIGNGIDLRVGRYGPYIERNGERVTISDEIAPDELTVDKAEELLSQASDERGLGRNPETGRAVLVKSGRYGPYVTEVAEEGEKPKTASLFKSMSPEAVTLDDVLPLLCLLRASSASTPGNGEDVIVSNGRFGPFLKRGSGHAVPSDRGARLLDV